MHTPRFEQQSFFPNFSFEDGRSAEVSFVARYLYGGKSTVKTHDHNVGGISDGGIAVLRETLLTCDLFRAIMALQSSPKEAAELVTKRRARRFYRWLEFIILYTFYRCF